MTFAQVIANGSFESPSVASNSFKIVAPASWTWDAVQGLIFNGKADTPWPIAESGQQFVDIGNASSFSLSQAITITNPANYELRWFDATASSANPQSSPYSVVLFNSAFQTVARTNFDAYRAQGNWQVHSLQLNLAKGTYLLRFLSQGNGLGLDTLLDNVTLAVLPDDLKPTIEVSQVSVCWLGQTGQVYQVQYKTNASSTTWLNLGGLVHGAGSNCVSDSVIGSQQRIYRILRGP